MKPMPIELLAPAGSPEALDAAIGEGADAVYLGLKTFNARMRSANFTYARFEASLRALRRMGKRLYVAVNTVFEQREADRMYQLLRYLSALGPDALIVQDFGVLAMARSQFPALKLHASTQMNIASGKGCNALSRRGVSRVVLARELCLDELRSIRSETNVELEVFAHGALCVSASGLCLFSSFLGGKSANRGLCAQACRRLYRKGETESGYYFSPADLQLLERLPDLAGAGINSVKIEGRMKSAEYVGAVVSAYRRALDAIAEGGEERIRRSIADGQRILRGDFARSKTAFYFDEAFSAEPALGALGAEPEPFEAGLEAEPEAPGLEPEPFEVGPEAEPEAPGLEPEPFEADLEAEPEAPGLEPEPFEADLEPELPEDGQGWADGGVDWLNPAQDGGTGISLGALLRVQGRDGQRRGLVSARNCAGLPPAVGDSVRLHKSDDSARAAHKLQHAEDGKGGCWISIPDGFDLGDRVYLIQTRSLARRYRPVVAGDAKGGRGPGHEKAPVPTVAIGAGHSGGSAAKGSAAPKQAAPRQDSRGQTRGQQAHGKQAAQKAAPRQAAPKAARAGGAFPEGLYVAVSRVEDMYVAQSSRPAKIILELNRKTARRIFSSAEGMAPPLPFKPADTILALDPFFPQAEAQALSAEMPALAGCGYRRFMANNPGHFPLFKDFRNDVQIIAGPWLYAFNAWALSFTASLGAEGFVSPLENSRQNLERTLSADPRLRERFFIPVFAYPPLFRIRADLGKQYGFKVFSDSRDESFLLAHSPEGSRVFPAKPFSIIDKISFLQDSGFRRFIVDLSGLPLKKTDYKDLMSSISKGIPLPDARRFNWKDGFFSEERPSLETSAPHR